MKKLRCKKEYGVWYYRKYCGWDYDEPVWELYDEQGEYITSFGYYRDMKYYVETGIII